MATRFFLGLALIILWGGCNEPTAEEPPQTTGATTGVIDNSSDGSDDGEEPDAGTDNGTLDGSAALDAGSEEGALDGEIHDDAGAMNGDRVGDAGMADGAEEPDAGTSDGFVEFDAGSTDGAAHADAGINEDEAEEDAGHNEPVVFDAGGASPVLDAGIQGPIACETGFFDYGEGCEASLTSASFANYIQADKVPGRFPESVCDTFTTHHACVANANCGWLRTIKDDGVCREDPVVRCLNSGECECRAHDFHGDAVDDEDLELFLPLSLNWENRAPSSDDDYDVTLEVAEILNESLTNFTSRTDFSHKTLTVRANSEEPPAAIAQAAGMTLTLKLMHVWDKEPAAMTGTLFEGLGMRGVIENDQLSLEIGTASYPITGETFASGALKNYQCNQIAIVMGDDMETQVHLGDMVTTLPGVTLSDLQNQMAQAQDPLRVLQIGAVNAKVWDVRLYGNDNRLSAEAIAAMGRRCGNAGDYAIPDGYPDSNRRYSWGMGGYQIVPDHATAAYASGVYVTMRIPSDDTFPPNEATSLENLQRMIGFWDRWHEQMFFELDMIPFVDTRNLNPEGSLNSYRNYTADDASLCVGQSNCGEPNNFNNPCRYMTDMFQAFNWLPEDFPGEPTSADHRKVAESGGWTRWDNHDDDAYASWQRPVHEHGHAAHFTLMRTYNKVHHYIRGIAGEAFAEIMAYYLFSGSQSWMNNGLTYYPSIPLAFEGRWDGASESHVFKSDQPYQSQNISDLPLGARFYGMGVWWTYVSHFAAKPYLVGRISGDNDVTPGSAMQKTRFYLAQEGLDLGELYGNYAAHMATWDWPHVGYKYYQQEQNPFQGIGGWCTENTGPNCTVDDLKIQADIDPINGTDGEWVEGPALRLPGGFASNTLRMDGAPGGALYEISLEFDVASAIYPGTDYSIGLKETCKNDPRLFSSRIVVVDEDSEGQEVRVNRPEYYKIPGRSVDKVIIQVPQGRDSNIYLIPVPTPPFELEDISPFVSGYSVVWPYQYKITRLDAIPQGAQKSAPILLEGNEMLGLTPQEGNGLVYDCFYDPAAALAEETFETYIEACLDFCASAETHNSGTDVSCNQQLTCRNACYLRADGAEVDECEAHCDRTGNSGCSLTVRGRDYNMCGACVGGWSSGMNLPQDCVAGCNFEAAQDGD